MQEKEKKVPANPDWSGFENWLAGEIIADKERIAKAKDIGLICGTAIAIVAIVGLLHNNYVQTQTMYQNDSQWRQVVQEDNQRWIDYLSEYDFVSQDGDGINNINTGEQGDLLNGAESQTQKEEE